MGGKWEPDPTGLQPGEASDRLVAEDQGVRRLTVLKYRLRNQVAPGGKMGRPVGTGWEPDPRWLQPGEASVADVAKAQKVSTTTVYRFLRRENAGRS